MKKTLAPIVGISIVAVVLAACSPGDSGESGGEPVSISFADWQFAEPGKGDALKAIVADYNEAQENCVVVDTTIPYPQYSKTLMTQLGAGSGPDVFNMDYGTWVLAQASDFLADLTEAIETPEAGFSQADENAFVDGNRYGVVWVSNAYALIVNKKLLDAAGVDVPTDFDEFREAAYALTRDGQFGFAFRNTMPEEAGWWADLSTWVYGFGGRWTDEDGNPTANSDEVLEAVTEYTQFFADQVVPQGADAATYRTMFWEGKIGMMIDNNSVPGIIVAENPDMLNDIEVVPQPFPTEAHLQGIFPLAVNAKSDPTKQECAAAFLNWILEPAQQEALLVASGGLAQATPVEAPAEFIQEHPWVSTYTTLNDGVLLDATGAEDKTAQIRNIVLTEIDKSMREGKPLETALDDAQARLEDLLGG